MALFQRYLIPALFKLLLLIFLAVVLVEADSWCEKNSGIQWHLNGTMCYGVAKTLTNHDDAKNQCNSFGGAELADVSKNDIRTFVRTQVIPADVKDSFWVGIAFADYEDCKDILKPKIVYWILEPGLKPADDIIPTCNAFSLRDAPCIDCQEKKGFICEKTANFKVTKKCKLDSSVNDDEWEILGRKCYYISKTAASWLTSATYCNLWFNATLAFADKKQVRTHLVRRVAGPDQDLYLWVNSTENIKNDACFALVVSTQTIISRYLNNIYRWCFTNYRFTCEVPLLD